VRDTVPLTQNNGGTRTAHTPSSTTPIQPEWYSHWMLHIQSTEGNTNQLQIRNCATQRPFL